MTAHNPPRALCVELESFEVDDVHVYLGQDMHGRWVWHVRFYSIGEVSALTLETDRARALDHLRQNLRRMSAALAQLALEPSDE